jgi:hypothetical protein
LTDEITNVTDPVSLVLDLHIDHERFGSSSDPITNRHLHVFERSFVAKTCRDIIDDVEKLDDIQDGFIHFQL